MKLNGARVLVTGASSGIGAALARLLATRGARLVVAARRTNLLEQLADDIARTGTPRPYVVGVDLARRGEASGLADEAVNALGGIDIVVNNAGAGVGGMQWSVGDSDAGRDVFETNVWSPVALVQSLVPPMRSRGSGAVVNVTSMAQVMTWPMLGHYAASKAALALFTETLRLELSGSGVHVLEVVPGPVATAVQGETRVVPGAERALRGVRLGRPDVLARRVADALERNAGRVVYPRLMRVPYALPGVVRVVVPRQVAAFADDLDADSSLVMRSGSHGDDLARRAREAWERGQRDFSELQRDVRAAGTRTPTDGSSPDAVRTSGGDQR